MIMGINSVRWCGDEEEQSVVYPIVVTFGSSLQSSQKKILSFKSGSPCVLCL
jgi:hypothetical protein